MERLETLLRALREAPAQGTETATLHTHPKYQPRDPTLARPADRSRLETASEDHVSRIRGSLAADAKLKLEPLLVAEVGGIRYVLDGHHRLKACQLAKRKSLHARILPMTEADAIMVAKLVNLDGTKLPMHAEQAREAAWQHLAQVTMRGKRGLPRGMSCRSVAARFSLKNGHDTVSRMLRKLLEVNPQEYSEAACDCGTGWPRWSAVKGNAFRDAFADTPVELREQARAEKLAATFLGRLDKESPGVRRKVAEVIRRDAEQEHAEALAEAVDEWTGTPSDY